ncbi:hypothetical protein PV392_11925 [Streptomyces sp. ME03-5709C]|nr:hypothetical protein [Streptomyces sp. ME03-5709C]
MLSQPTRFRRYLSVNLFWRSVAVLKDVVLVIQQGERLRQGQLVPKALVDQEGKLSWRQLSCQHSPRQRSRGSLPSSDATGWIEGEPELFQRRRQKVGNVINGFCPGAPSQAPQCGTVEAGHECVASSTHHVVRADLPDAPESGTMLKSC